MMILKDLRGSMINAEKVSETGTITLINDKGTTTVLANSKSVFFKSMEQNGCPDETSEFILDSKAVRLVKLTDVCDDLSIQKAGQSLIIKGGTTIANIPLLTEKATMHKSNLKLANLVDISEVRNVMFAAVNNTQHPLCNAIHFKVLENELELVALDGYRIATSVISLKPLAQKGVSPIPKGTTFVIGKNELNTVLSIIQDNTGISYDMENKMVHFIQDKAIISVKTLDGQYPDYQGMLETSLSEEMHPMSNILIDRDSLLKECDKCDLTGNKKVTLEIDNTVLKIASLSSELSIVGVVRLSTAKVTKSTQISLNVKYLADALKFMEDEEISIDFSNSMSPIVCKAKNRIGIVIPIMPEVVEESEENSK